MAWIDIIDRFKVLLKDNSEAQLALNEFKVSMSYAAPECQDYRFWTGTIESPGICIILCKYAKAHKRCQDYFKKLVENYNKTKTLEDV